MAADTFELRSQHPPAEVDEREVVEHLRELLDARD